MENNNDGKYAGFYSKKLKAGTRRTYFFDVRSTKQKDYFITITESKKKFEGDGYESHKIYLYKEDFKKFVESLNETINYVKTDLMPDFDYEAERKDRPGTNHSNHRPKREPNLDLANHRTVEKDETNYTESSPPPTPPQIGDDEQMDWN